MDHVTRLILRVPTGDADSLLELLDPENSECPYEVVRVSRWRSIDLPWSEIAISLSSAGSVGAIASVVRAWLASTKAKIEVIAEATGERLTYEGPAARLPTDQIRELLSRPASGADHAGNEDENG